ncbi:hypothetical protein GA0061102_1003150 [Rhizobium miluonense]|uniref:Uncharacterized protein n=1 Tax=Rhizobium miluonense TaxID=411945 RepID=A0A1C3UF77_9HYPH|nr:hypothetical protein GA0061102_1003150 [Rhizobium miluonense]
MTFMLGLESSKTELNLARYDLLHSPFDGPLRGKVQYAKLWRGRRVDMI